VWLIDFLSFHFAALFLISGCHQLIAPLVSEACEVKKMQTFCKTKAQIWGSAQ